MKNLTPLTTATRNGFTVHYSRLDSGDVLVVTPSEHGFSYAFVTETHFRNLIRGYAVPEV